MGGLENERVNTVSGKASADSSWAVGIIVANSLALPPMMM
jgi:hypothetical protein